MAALTVELVFETAISEQGLYESHRGVFFCDRSGTITQHCNELAGDLYAIPLHIQRNQTGGAQCTSTQSQVLAFSGQNFMAGFEWAFVGFLPVVLVIVAVGFLFRSIWR